MIDLNQDVVVKWNPATRSWYEEKGYVFTQFNKELVVKARDLKTKSTAKVIVNCDYCGCEKSLPYLYYNKSTKGGNQKYCCSDCIPKKMDETYFDNIRKEQFQHFVDECYRRGYSPTSTLDDYKNAYSVLEFICPEHGKKRIVYNNFMHSTYGCDECGYESTSENNKLSMDDVIAIVNSKNGNILKNPQDYVNFSTNNLIIQCGTCGNDFTTSLASQVNGNGNCKNCGDIINAAQLTLSPDEVEKRINSVNGNTLLNKDDYRKNSTRNLNIRCSCGNIFTVSLANYEQGTNRCQLCSQRISSGEILVMRILDELDIEYITEYKFPDCKAKKELPFDFYLPGYGRIIEFDGEQHFSPVFGEESFERTQRNDAIKNKYCEENNIPLLRIPFWEGSNAKQMISNFLHLTNYPLVIHYHKNPFN